MKNKAAQSLARRRWKGTTAEERKLMVPKSHGGGRPRIYPQCPTYRAHRFSVHADGVDRCPCGYERATGRIVVSKPKWLKKTPFVTSP